MFELCITRWITPRRRAELRMFVHRVAKSRISAYSTPIKLNADGKEFLYRIATHYAGDRNKEESDLLLVSFEELKVPESPVIDESTIDSQTAHRIGELEQELALNRENLQMVIEELETSNEELQSLNEEAQAANEELQVTNEELETSNEELQASNEELITVNDELNNRTLELAKTNTDLTNILNSLYKGLLVVDTNLMITRFNQIALNFFDIPDGPAANIATVHSKYEMPDLLKHLQHVIRTGEIVEYEFRGKSEQSFLIRLSPYIDHYSTASGVTGVVLTIHDITDIKAAEEKLKLLASVFEHSAEGTMITDSANKIIAVNPAFTKITGYAAEDVLGQNPRILSSGKHAKDFFHAMWKTLDTSGVWQGEIENKRKDGEVYTEFLSITAQKDESGKINRHIAVFNDISSSKRAQEIIERQANYDDLTGLPNRNLIRDRIEQTLLSARRSGEHFAVMFMDLDDFKAINDSLGHDAGDELLLKVSQKIRSALRESDLVGRLGGDEFIVLVKENISIDAIITVANKILSTINQPVVIAGHTLNTRASIGVTTYPADGTSVDTLMKNADSAMYEAKHLGRNTFCFFTQHMQDNANRRQWLKTELGNALARQQIQLHYQPIIDLNTMQVIGAEALLRWYHPQKGLIGPDRFIPVAEQNGLISTLSQWVIGTGLSEVKTIRKKIDPDFHIAINISMAEFLSQNHTKWLHQTFGNSTLAQAGGCTLELTESIKFIDNDNYRNTLERMKECGCKIALDDFGTGQSSLSYIKQVAVDLIKIDKSFIRDIAIDPSDAAMVQAILKMAKAFELSSVAEGVENEEQLEFLRKNACEYAQGYLFGKAMPFDGLVDFITNSQWAKVTSSCS